MSVGVQDHVDECGTVPCQLEQGSGDGFQALAPALAPMAGDEDAGDLTVVNAGAGSLASIAITASMLVFPVT
jgi:hypothetical protein